MKKMFDEEFNLDEIKNSLRKLQKSSKEKNCWITALVIISIVAVVATMAVAIVKLTNKNDLDDLFDEDFDEDYDDYYASDEDFEQ